LKTQIWGQNPKFGAVGQIILKVPKSNETYRTGECDVITFSENAIHNNTIKQYMEIAVISRHCWIGPIMMQITVKYFNFKIIVD